MLIFWIEIYGMLGDVSEQDTVFFQQVSDKFAALHKLYLNLYFSLQDFPAPTLSSEFPLTLQY